MRRIDITIDEETDQILEVYKASNKKVSWVIREAVKNYYKFNKPKVSFDGVDTIYE